MGHASNGALSVLESGFKFGGQDDSMKGTDEEHERPKGGA